MAQAAQLAHPAGLPARRRDRGIALLVIAGLALAPTAATASEATAGADRVATEPAPSPSPAEAAPATETPAPAETPAADEAASEAAAPATTEAPAEPEPATDEAETTEAEPSDDEIDGTPVDDEAADEDLEDEDEADDAPPPPSQGEALRPMQTAAWWTMFGAFAVGTTAGVLGGLAERQEDRATRLSTLFDTSTGAQPVYADRQEEYEGYLSRGDAYAKAAIGVGVLAGVTAIASITLFAIDARRQRTEKKPSKPPRASVSISPGNVRVRF
ncbi:MAG: hypothetical protein AAF799_15940 [Myxococcota bacterium]